MLKAAGSGCVCSAASCSHDDKSCLLEPEEGFDASDCSAGTLCVFSDVNGSFRIYQ